MYYFAYIFFKNGFHPFDSILTGNHCYWLISLCRATCIASLVFSQSCPTLHLPVDGQLFNVNKACSNSLPIVKLLAIIQDVFSLYFVLSPCNVINEFRTVYRYVSPYHICYLSFMCIMYHHIIYVTSLYLHICIIDVFYHNRMRRKRQAQLHLHLVTVYVI